MNVFSNTPNARWVAHIKRDIYSCSYYSFMLVYKIYFCELINVIALCISSLLFWRSAFYSHLDSSMSTSPSVTVRSHSPSPILITKQIFSLVPPTRASMKPQNVAVSTNSDNMFWMFTAYSFLKESNFIRGRSFLLLERTGDSQGQSLIFF